MRQIEAACSDPSRPPPPPSPQHHPPNISPCARDIAPPHHHAPQFYALLTATRWYIDCPHAVPYFIVYLPALQRMSHCQAANYKQWLVNHIQDSSGERPTAIIHHGAVDVHTCSTQAYLDPTRHAHTRLPLSTPTRHAHTRLPCPTPTTPPMLPATLLLLHRSMITHLLT